MQNYFLFSINAFQASPCLNVKKLKLLHFCSKGHFCRNYLCKVFWVTTQMKIKKLRLQMTNVRT